MYKRLIAGLIVIMSPLYCMKKNKPLPSGIMLLTKDIACNQIQPWLTFQEISRLKRSSKDCNKLYDIEINCPYMRGEKCSTYACNYCAKSYYQCTKMLVYFALKRNELMFQHVWAHHKAIRKNNIVRLLQKNKTKIEVTIKGERSCYCKSEITIKEEMGWYRKRYRNLNCIHRHLFYSAIKAIKKDDILLANTILSESGLSLFDLSKKTVESYDDLEDLFYKACSLYNTDLIKNICGGCVDKHSFPYVIWHADPQLLFDLIDENILPADSASKDGKKSVLHYAAERGFDNVIKIALENGAYPNCRDFYGKTPLHYAVKNSHLGVVIELLNSTDADVRLKDKKGKTASDCNVSSKKHLLHIPKVTDARKEIARLLQEHRDQHRVSGYSYSKVHPNGYQEIYL